MGDSSIVMIMFTNFIFENFVDDIVGRKNAENEAALLDMKFHDNGNELWVMSKNLHIIVFDTQQWHITKAASSPDRYYVKMSSFVSSAFVQNVIHKSSSLSLRSICIGATSSKKLVFLTETDENHAIDFKSFLPWKCVGVKRFVVSPNSELLALIAVDGTLKLYSIEFILRHNVFYTMPPKISTIDHVNKELSTLDRKVVVTRKASDFVIVKKTLIENFHF